MPPEVDVCIIMLACACGCMCSSGLRQADGGIRARVTYACVFLLLCVLHCSINIVGIRVAQGVGVSEKSFRW